MVNPAPKDGVPTPPGRPPSRPTADNTPPIPTKVDSDQLLFEKVDVLHVNSGFGLAVNVVVGALTVAAVWPGRAPWAASLWLGVLYSVVALRLHQRMQFQLHAHERPAAYWLRRFSLSTAATGLCWGAAWLILPPDATLATEMLMAVVMAGLVAGALSHLAMVFEVYRNYVILAIVPGMVYLLAQGTRIHLLCAALSMVYLFGVLNSARRFHRVLHRSLEVRFENAGLVTSLTDTNTRLRALTDELERRVIERTTDLESELAKRQQAQAALRADEEMFRLISDNVSDMIAVWDGHGQQLYGSRSLRGAMDRSQTGPGTFSFSEVHQEDLEKLRAALRQALASSRGQRLELRLGGASVDQRIIDCSIEPVRDPAGEPDKVVIVSRDVTQRRREEAAIREARERLALALEATDQISFDVDCRVQKVHLDRNWAAFLGRRSVGETIASFDELLPLVPAEEHALIHTRYVATLKGETADYVMEHRVRRDDGEYRWILSRARVVERDARGYAIRLTGTNRDITDRRLAEQSLRLAGRALDSMAEGLVVLDSNWRVSSVNQAFSRITGYSAEEAVGKVSRLWRDSVRNQEEPSAIVAELAVRGHWEGRVVDRRRDGSAYPSWLSASTIREADGGISHYVIVFSDMSKQERDAQRVRYLAYHDGLTGLANRSMFFERCGDILRRAQRHGRRMAILFIDLDHFKSVNDSLGHLAGDVLLIEVARRLLQDLRDLDLVARLGGDEFAVLLEEIAQPSDAATVALKILGSLAQPVAIGGDEVRITASIGISCFPDDADQVENLLRQADAAMYVAKQEGRDRYQFFSPDLTARVMNRLATASALKVALERGEFRVHYQPAVDARTGEIVGLEALLRWQHPQRGLLLPNEFIQVAEDTGVIDAIGRWVLTMACRQLALWQKSGHEGLSMKVNLSPLQFRQPTLVHDVKRILLASGVQSGTLEIEITESAAMNNPDRSERVLQDMLELGIRVSLDDFGTGHSSLAQLSRFPIHGLKLDRSLVCGLPDDRKNVVIASSVASLCRNLGLDLVGEGVETAAQAEFLMSQGCRQMQGFYFSPAVSAEELTAMLAQPDHAAWKMAGSALH